jgi:hypothetical protein
MMIPDYHTSIPTYEAGRRWWHRRQGEEAVDVGLNAGRQREVVDRNVTHEATHFTLGFKQTTIERTC